MSSAGKAVFLSYASQDAEAAQRVCDALRTAGVEVWFDQNELRGGDAWDRNIRRQIAECALFIPFVSEASQLRPEGYFRLEWHLAEQRSLLIAKGRPFIVPVCLDGVTEREALVPDSFLAVQWTRLKADEAVTAKFAAHVQQLLVRQSIAGLPSRSLAPVSTPATATDGPPRIPDFELIRAIGQGSYGDVWLARGLTGVYRAIKIVWRNRFKDAEPFEREFKGLKKFTTMSRPEAGQMALLHVGQNEAAGYFYYVMELADDVHTGDEINPAKYTPLTLREVRARRGRLPAAECVTYGVELARALAGLHSRGLVHRDIKPSNVILVAGVPKLADIGLVASTTDALTYVGTEGFVPPEGPGKPGADVYAFGRLMYELVTGLDRDEFPRLPPELNQVADRKLLFELNEIILRACDSSVERRYRDASAVLADLQVLQAGHSLRRRGQTRLVRGLAVGCGLAAVIAGGLSWWLRPAAPVKTATPAVQATATAAANSVAVLPFANLSGDKDQEYFSDGITEEILNALVRQPDLRVPGRTSSFSFKGKNIPEADIARTLNVSRLVEGSVQRVGQHVRVTVRLTRAADGFSEELGTFDRELTDIFALQDEIARTVVEKITHRAATSTVAVLTKTPAAYDLLLRARRMLRDAPTADSRQAEMLRRSESLLQSAVELDPDFAVAWSYLADAHAQIYFFDVDHTAGRQAMARAALDHALRLAPDNPDVIRNEGAYYYRALRDYVHAEEQYRRLLSLQPNDSEGHLLLALLLRRIGKWSEALAEFRRAYELDPGNAQCQESLLVSLVIGGRRYAEAEAVAASMAHLDPDPLGDQRLDTYEIPFMARGSTKELDDYLTALPADIHARPEYANARRALAEFRGDWAEIARLDALQPQPPENYLEVAINLTALGRLEDARRILAGHPEDLRARLRLQPANRTLFVQLAQVEALLGHKAEALEALRQARAQLPAGGDNLDETDLINVQGQVLLWTGDKEGALKAIAIGLQRPHGLNVHALRSAAEYALLRGDPRFEALLNDPANNAPLIGEPGEAAPAFTVGPVPATQETPPAPVAPANSIAVLPFANYSDDKENAYFADGVYDDILTNLADLSVLRIIARTSMLQYRATTKPIKQIGAELNVAYVLEGSVRRVGNKVRVAGQLIRAATEEQIWAKSYDRDLTDVFAIQSELSHEIVTALKGVLTAQDESRLTRHPTTSIAAYELYQRAREIERNGQDYPAISAQQLPLLEQAVQLDPNYVEAWAGIGAAHLHAYEYAFDPDPAKLPLARAALARAEQLDPDNYLVLTTGASLGAVTHDRALVNRHRQRIAELFPNRAEARYAAGLTAEDEARWDDAIAAYREAQALDPRNEEILGSLGNLLGELRRYDECAVTLQQLRALKPAALDLANAQAYLPLHQRGSTAELQAFLAGLPANPGGADPSLTSMRVRALFALGDAAGAARLWHEIGSKWTFAGGALNEASAAMVLRAAQDPTDVRALLEQGRDHSREMVAKNPKNIRRWSQLGLYQALLGATAEARSTLAHVREMVREDRTVPEIEYTDVLFYNAVWRAWAGEKEEAVAQLTRVLKGPTFVPHAYVEEMRHSMLFLPLHGDPAFEALLNDPVNNAPVYGNGAKGDSPSVAAPAFTFGPAPVANDGPPVQASVPVDEKSVAVLPLENLSPDPENAFFTDGMHAEIIGTLARISDVKIIARSSTQMFKGSTESLHAIAQKLGVANVITGSVRRAGDKVRIVLELRRASDESLLWTQTYDREVKDVIAIQTDIAGEVARVLQARNAPTGREIAELLTKDPRAFDLFWKAMQQNGQAGRDLVKIEKVISLLEEVMRVDPAYVSAAQSLSYVEAYAAAVDYDVASREHHKQRAKQWAETAARLAPGGIGDGALAYYYSFVERDPGRALPYAENQVRALPNGAEGYDLLALALRLLGHKNEAAAQMERALALSPLDSGLWGDLASTLADLRRVPEGRKALDRMIELGQGSASPQWIAEIRYRLDGSLPSFEGLNSRRQTMWLRRGRRYAEALAQCELALVAPENGGEAKVWLWGWKSQLLHQLGLEKEAMKAAETYLTLAKEQVVSPGVGWAEELELATALARSGRADEAVAQGLRGVAALSEATQPADRWYAETSLAAVYAELGRSKECVELLTRLLQVPSGLTVPMLQGPDWDNVRNDPAFQALLADPKNSAPL